MITEVKEVILWLVTLPVFPNLFCLKKLFSEMKAARVTSVHYEKYIGNPNMSPNIFDHFIQQFFGGSMQPVPLWDYPTLHLVFLKAILSRQLTT